MNKYIVLHVIIGSVDTDTMERADAVDSKEGATWDSLSTGLRSINENAVADELDKESESTPAC